MKFPEVVGFFSKGIDYCQDHNTEDVINKNASCYTFRIALWPIRFVVYMINNKKKEDSLSQLLVKNAIYAYDLNKYLENHQHSKLENKANQSFLLC